MSLRAVHRLGEAELPSLGHALREMERLEAELVRSLTGMRRAAEREAQARRQHGLAGSGTAREGYRAARRLLAGVTNARDALSTEG